MAGDRLWVGVGQERALEKDISWAVPSLGPSFSWQVAGGTEASKICQALGHVQSLKKKEETFALADAKGGDSCSL